MNNNEFGKRLKELRRQKGFTQQALAEKADIDEKHLSRIENGKFFPSYSTLVKILNALNTDFSEVGIGLEKVSFDKNPHYIKALQILNSAQSDDELCCYLEAIKAVQKAVSIKNNN